MVWSIIPENMERVPGVSRRMVGPKGRLPVSR